jgi:hypothetical protein
MLPCSNLKRRTGLATVFILLLLGGGHVFAQAAKDDGGGGLKKESPQDFRVHLDGVKALVQACAASAVACQPDKIGADDRVVAPDAHAQTFQVRWQWLRNTLDEARKANADRRSQLMQQSSARLAEMVQQTAQPQSPGQFVTARKDADRILAGSEFAAVEPQSWLDRMVAKFWNWVQLWLASVAGLGSAAPWIGPLLEWLLFASAGVGLLLFVRRSLQRQRLAVALNSQSTELAWARESNDWAMQAENSARVGDWRDAVHCLYWATIVMLEGRRAWRHNPARTPREYVRLLKPGSAQQGSLRGLTQIFERLWYGLRDANSADYERARTLYESLRENSPAGAA